MLCTCTNYVFVEHAFTSTCTLFIFIATSLSPSAGIKRSELTGYIVSTTTRTGNIHGSMLIESILGMCVFACV